MFVKARPGDRALLDLHGNHAHGKCPSGMKGLHSKHRLLNSTLQDFAKLAGASVVCEPSTADVLQRALSAEQCTCRSLFLKSPNAEQKRQMAELAEELRGLPQPCPPERRAVVDAKYAALAEARVAIAGDKVGKGLDLQIIDI